MTIKRLHIFALLVLLLGALFVAGCWQGRPSSKPPIHLNPSMDRQPKYLAFEKSEFFANASVMRPPVEGTVARGQLWQFQNNPDSVAWYTGFNVNGDTLNQLPIPMTMENLQRGQERYNIYCAPCHSRLGDGNGMTVKRGMLRPPSFHEERLRTAKDGHFFFVMTHGIRNMSSYAYQVPATDRWKIVAYIRALQKSQHATEGDIPADMRDKVQ